jgi:predicted nucleotidyltransferase
VEKEYDRIVKGKIMEIIKKVYKEKTEKLEKLRRGFLDKIFIALKKLSEDVYFEEAYIFGSVTERYKFDNQSDIDIAFKGLERDKLFYTVSFLSRELDREVNAVHIEDIHFKDKIMREGIKWKKD